MFDRQYDVVEVRWLDSISSADWITREDAVTRSRADGVMRSVSCGLLIDETEDYILLAGSHMRDGDLVCGTMQIPTASVLSLARFSDEVEHLPLKPRTTT